MGEGSAVALSRGVGHRRGLNLALLWLWRRPAATAPMRPLAWDPPYAVGATLKKKKKTQGWGASLESLLHLELPCEILGAWPCLNFGQMKTILV